MAHRSPGPNPRWVIEDHCRAAGSKQGLETRAQLHGMVLESAREALALLHRRGHGPSRGGRSTQRFRGDTSTRRGVRQDRAPGSCLPLVHEKGALQEDLCGTLAELLAVLTETRGAFQE